MPKARAQFEVGFDPIDANRIRLAAQARGMTIEEFIRWATQQVIERSLEEWLGKDIEDRKPS